MISEIKNTLKRVVVAAVLFCGVEICMASGRLPEIIYKAPNTEVKVSGDSITVRKDGKIESRVLTAQERGRLTALVAKVRNPYFRILGHEVEMLPNYTLRIDNRIMYAATTDGLKSDSDISEVNAARRALSRLITTLLEM